MAKKNSTKKNRRLIEIKKAQKNTANRTSIQTQKQDALPTEQVNHKEEAHKLPIRLIKKDVTKTLVFAGMAIVLLVLIANSGITYQVVLGYLGVGN